MFSLRSKYWQDRALFGGIQLQSILYSVLYSHIENTPKFTLHKGLLIRYMETDLSIQQKGY